MTLASAFKSICGVSFLVLCFGHAGIRELRCEKFIAESRRLWPDMPEYHVCIFYSNPFRRAVTATNLFRSIQCPFWIYASAKLPFDDFNPRNETMVSLGYVVARMRFAEPPSPRISYSDLFTAPFRCCTIVVQSHDRKGLAARSTVSCLVKTDFSNFIPICRASR